jgi:hypothetical protein
MTTRILIIVAGLVLAVGAVLVVLKIRGGRSTSGGATGTATSQPGADPEAMADLKNLLFADQSLDELLSMFEPTQTPLPNDPMSLFASSVAASRANKTDEAKNQLKHALALPGTESRIQLWAWKGLRELGEPPPEDVADKVQGVVCELHNEAGVGTLAAYADGRARWLSSQGAGVVWEVPGSDATISALITKLLKAAEPLVKAAPLSDTHRTPEPEIENFRVSILTYSGIRTVEVYGPSIEQNQPIAALLEASVNLLAELTRKSAETESKPSPR